MVKLIFPLDVEILPNEEALVYERKDCDSCVANANLLRRHPKWYGLVNKYTKDIIGVSP